jgi:hypothetical protein
VASLISGVLGIVLPLVGVLAIILGGIGLDRTRRRGTRGRGMALTGVTLGSIQVVLTAVVLVSAWALWNAYGEDVERGLAQIEELSGADADLSSLVLGGLSDGVSLDDLQELAGSVGDADELRGLADDCAAGSTGACEDLLERVPTGMLPDDVSQNLPSGG